MKTRIRGIILGSVLLVILCEIDARPNRKDKRSSRLSQTEETREKTKQVAIRQKQTQLVLRDRVNENQHGARELRTSKPLKKSKNILSLKHNYERKRQYIMHPFHTALPHPYMLMRPPPMTQRTIVTTRIPRPPMPIPYNEFFSRGLYGGMHHRAFPFSLYDPMRMYTDDEEDEEGK